MVRGFVYYIWWVSRAPIRLILLSDYNELHVNCARMIFAQSGSVTKEGTVRTQFTHQDPQPSSHAYNDPDLSPIEFLYAVMRATHQPMSIRIEAAKALLPFTNPYPRSMNSVPRCTIV